MSGLDLDALAALCNGATPGPWVIRDGAIVDADKRVVARGPALGTHSARGAREDAEFIAAARAAVPALITRLRAAEARSAWQPMETAPLRQPVLLWLPEWGESAIGYLNGNGEVVIDGEACAIEAATHWMPLPAPPTGGAHG